MKKPQGLNAWQIEEYTRCAKDFCYFSDKYVKINHPMHGLIPFKLYPFQERVIRDFNEYQYNIVSKFRQAGLTTVALIWAMWRCIFKLDQRIMVMCKTDREATGIGKIVENAKEQLPDWIMPLMKDDNDHVKEFASTGSSIEFRSPQAARSKSLTYLIIDEAAFIPNMEEAWKAMYPTISTGGNAIVISTVNGIGNWYHKIYTEAQDKTNLFHIIDLDYREHPEYNSEEWARKTQANVGAKGWAQEYLRTFFGSGDTYIPSTVLIEMARKTCDPIRKLFPQWDTYNEKDNPDQPSNKEYVAGAMWIWKEATPGREYLISADASEGVGDEGDYSAFHVFDINSLDQVAEFYSNVIPAHKFAQVLKQAGEYYNTAIVCVENTLGSGMAVCERLQHSLYYENLYYKQKLTGGERCGMAVNSTCRPMILDTMQTCLWNNLIKINSNRTVRELNTFIFDKNRQKAMAQKGKHDDLVLSLAIGLYAMDILHREMPLGSQKMPDMIEKSFITSGLEGKEFDSIREDFDLGRAEDFFADNNDEDDKFLELFANIIGDKPKRRDEKILKEFNW